MLDAKGVELNENQFGILLRLALHPNYTRKDLMKEYPDITSDGIQYILGRLQQLGLLRREGGRKTGRWVVMLDNDKETGKGE